MPRVVFPLLSTLLLLSTSPRHSTAATVVMEGPASTPEPEKKALLAMTEALTVRSNRAFWRAAGWRPNSKAPCTGNDSNWKYITCGRQASITGIDIGMNKMGLKQLEGTIPWGQMGALVRLKDFLCPNQGFYGAAIPEDMPLLTSLTNLVLAGNKFSSISSQISQLPNLQVLSLKGNSALTGSIPDKMSVLTNLESIDLAYTALTGTLPQSLSTLQKLTALDVQSSSVSGNLPESYSALTSLRVFKVPRNFLTGAVPLSYQSLNGTLTRFSVGDNQLTGEFPAAILAFSKLEQLDLENNKFHGPVPDAVWKLQAKVDISGNFFNGSVPSGVPGTTMFHANCFTSVGSLSENGTMRSPTECENFYTSLYYVPPEAKTVNLGLVLGLSLGLGAAVIVGALLLFRYIQRRNRLATRLRKGTMQSTREFTLAELKSATKNWSMELGRGGYGAVYKAVFRDGTTVAVKRSDQSSDQGDKEFIREVELLSRVHHRHLVNLVGFCGEKGERALVYEYMGLGSLYDHLHGECSKEQTLTWDSRIKIAIHVAFGIDYLHYGADPPLIHRDIKSANILLSDDGYAKVADFGLCKEAPVGVSGDGTAQLVPEATEVKGSFGYLDPEYVNTSVLSEKSDVYSYGVVLLELITGKKSIHDWQPLAYWAEPYLEDPNKLVQLVDPALDGEYDFHEVQILCDIARSCTYDQAAMRPAIRDVAQALVENLGRVVASTGSTSEPSTYASSDLASSADPSDPSEMSATFSTPSEFSFRNAASEALLLGFKKKEGEEDSSEDAARRRPYVMATGPDGSKPPVPVGKYEGTV